MRGLPNPPCPNVARRSPLLLGRLPPVGLRAAPSAELASVSVVPGAVLPGALGSGAGAGADARARDALVQTDHRNSRRWSRRRPCGLLSRSSRLTSRSRSTSTPIVATSAHPRVCALRAIAFTIVRAPVSSERRIAASASSRCLSRSEWSWALRSAMVAAPSEVAGAEPNAEVLRGRPTRQAGGHWFEPSTAHHRNPRTSPGFRFLDRQQRQGRARKMLAPNTGPRAERRLTQRGQQREHYEYATMAFVVDSPISTLPGLMSRGGLRPAQARGVGRADLLDEDANSRGCDQGLRRLREPE